VVESNWTVCVFLEALMEVLQVCEWRAHHSHLTTAVLTDQKPNMFPQISFSSLETPLIPQPAYMLTREANYQLFFTSIPDPKGTFCGCFYNVDSLSQRVRRGGILTT